MTSWRPDPDALRGRIAVVAGATRGAGRGVAAALGEAGATVICSSRTRALKSDYGRPETIEETAELVTSLGGQGVPFVEVTDGTADYNTSHYRISVFYDLAKVAINRLAFSQGHELAPHQATVVAVTPGWLRSEMMLDAYKVTEDNRRTAAAPPGFAVSESPRYVGRAVVALATDPTRQRWNQRSVTSAQLAAEYGFTDIDGSRPDVWRYEQAVEAGGQDVNPGDYR